MRLAIVFLLLLLALAACSSSREGTDSVPERERTTVRVRNENFLDMTIYIVRGTQRHRLGVVTSNQSRVFTIPDYLVFGAQSLQFLADPIGSARTPITQSIAVIPGEEVDLIIR